MCRADPPDASCTAIAKRINAAVKKQRSKRVDAAKSLEVEVHELRRPAADLAEDQADAPDGGADR